MVYFINNNVSSDSVRQVRAPGVGLADRFSTDYQ